MRKDTLFWSNKSSFFPLLKKPAKPKRIDKKLHEPPTKRASGHVFLFLSDAKNTFALHLSEIKLINFKNYQSTGREFVRGLNLIVGPNGSGKTNLLDAIHVLSTGRGAFNHIDSQHIRWKEPFFSLKGDFVLGEKTHEVQCVVERGKRKVLRCDGKEYPKLSEHYGRFPLVLITPYDTDLVREGSQTRRKFFDSIIAQLDRSYLQNLFAYQQVLKQCNEALRKMAEQRYQDNTLLDAYAAQLLPLNKAIAARRERFIQAFQPIFTEVHQEVAQNSEQVSLKYRSELQEENFERIFYQNRDRDLGLQRVEKGIHQDKYPLEIERRSLKKFGSQGQQKTFVLALKLAQFEVIRQEKGYPPLLLLDDIFDKLDTARTRRLIQLISVHHAEQVFLTDATPERSQALLERIAIPLRVLHTTKATRP